MPAPLPIDLLIIAHTTKGQEPRIWKEVCKFGVAVPKQALLYALSRNSTDKKVHSAGDSQAQARSEESKVPLNQGVILSSAGDWHLLPLPGRHVPMPKITVYFAIDL